MPGSNRFFLNALRENGRTLRPPDAGRWNDDSQDSEFLARYSSDIHITGQISDASVSHSVPSVFARPVQFDQALSDAANPLHQTLVGEWRGLLAAFGLQRFERFSVTAVPFDVPPERKGETSEPGSQGDGNLHLRTILRNQLPQRKEDWARFWLLYCGDYLIGATSPWTVVYTPAEYRCPEVIPWQKDGRLIDPILHYAREAPELSMLQRWVALIKNSKGDDHWAFPKHLDRKASTITTQLDNWLADLAKFQRPQVRFELSSTPAIEEPPYSRILTPPEETDIPAPSDLLLHSQKLGERQVLTLSRTKLSPGDRVYGPVLVNQLDMAKLRGPRGDRLTSRGGHEMPIEYIIPEELFLPARLLELPLSPDSMQRGSAAFCIPLTPEFFEYFSHRDLTGVRDMLTVAESGASVRVTLRLPLKGSSGRHLTLEKTYDRAAEVIRLTSGTPAFAVWPDFYAEDWDENFAGFADIGNDELQVAPLLADGKQLEKSGPTQRPVRIWKCLKPPIGFLMLYRNPNTNETFPAGLVLRSTLPAPAEVVAERSWEVGVDFGTSSTTVMVKKNGHESQLLALTGRTRFLTQGQPDRQEALENNLYSASTQMPPFGTALYESAATVIGGNAFGYTLRFKYFPLEASKLVPNVKWGSNGSSGQTALQEYLNGLVRYIVSEARCEGVGSLSFHWSYPLSLPERPLNAMRDFWNNVALTYERKGSMQVNVAGSISESDAICRGLANLPAGVLNIRSNALTVAVDIGGGSTDVGLWTSANLVDQFSFNLAGNDILDPRWLSYPDLLSTLYLACIGTDIPQSERQVAERLAGVYFNDLLTNSKDPSGVLFKGGDPRYHPAPMRIHSGPANRAPWKYIRTLAYLFFTGVAYYIGLHSRKRLPDVREIKIYVGGRGSSLLTWIGADGTRNATILADAFNAGFKRQPDSEAKVEFVGPALGFHGDYPPLKQEVALGLLSAALGGQVNRKITTPLGEAYWLGRDNNSLDWDQETTLEDFAGLRPPPNHESSFIMHFLKTVPPMHAGLNLDIEALGRLRLSTAAVQDFMKRLVEKQILQPVFASELKTLMNQYLDGVLRESLRPDA